MSNKEYEKQCGVPMWTGGGMPAGMCDNVAYGKRPDAKTHRRWDGFEWRDDGKYTGYVIGDACPRHGGPTLKEVSHKGDPCIHCGTLHYDVAPGPCPILLKKYEQPITRG